MRLTTNAGVFVAVVVLSCSVDDTSNLTGDAASGDGDGGGSKASADGSSPAVPASDGGGSDGRAATTKHGCASPGAGWLMCEDFEGSGGGFDPWFAGSSFVGGVGTTDRGRVKLATDQVHGGMQSLFMPAAAGSGYQGASLDWWACDGAKKSGCPLRSFDKLYFRAWVRFAEDHQSTHHFLSIGGSQPGDFDYHGTAGCMPNGSLAMGTTADFKPKTHETLFYTYFPGQSCDTNCGSYMDVNAICTGCASKGLPTCQAAQQCCWGKVFSPTPPVALPVGKWFCLEMMMKANTPSVPDGEQAYWVDGVLANHVGSMRWRTSPTLALNRVRLQHYNETEDVNGHSNRAWFDDVVVSTQPIGCD